MENKKWSLEEFIELLNSEIPLTLLQKNDKRRTDVWNKRLLRSYVSAKKISLPYKEGKFAFYTDKHLQEVKALIAIQGMGISSKVMPNSNEYQRGFYSKLAESSSLTANAVSNTISLSGNYGTEKSDILTLLSEMKSAPIYEKKEPLWKKINIGADVELIISDKHWDKIEQIKNELKKITGE